MDWQEVINRFAKIEVKLKEKANLVRAEGRTYQARRVTEEIRCFPEKIRTDQEKIIAGKKERGKRTFDEGELRKKQTSQVT